MPSFFSEHRLIHNWNPNVPNDGMRAPEQVPGMSDMMRIYQTYRGNLQHTNQFLNSHTGQWMQEQPHYVFGFQQPLNTTWMRYGYQANGYHGPQSFHQWQGAYAMTNWGNYPSTFQQYFPYQPTFAPMQQPGGQLAYMPSYQGWNQTQYLSMTRPPNPPPYRASTIPITPYRRPTPAPTPQPLPGAYPGYVPQADDHRFTGVFPQRVLETVPEDLTGNPNPPVTGLSVMYAFEFPSRLIPTATRALRQFVEATRAGNSARTTELRNSLGTLLWHVQMAGRTVTVDENGQRFAVTRDTVNPNVRITRNSEVYPPVAPPSAPGSRVRASLETPGSLSAQARMVWLNLWGQLQRGESYRETLAQLNAMLASRSMSSDDRNLFFYNISLFTGSQSVIHDRTRYTAVRDGPGAQIVVREESVDAPRERAEKAWAIMRKQTDETIEAFRRSPSRTTYEAARKAMVDERMAIVGGRLLPGETLAGDLSDHLRLEDVQARQKVTDPLTRSFENAFNRENMRAPLLRLLPQAKTIAERERPGTAITLSLTDSAGTWQPWIDGVIIASIGGVTHRIAFTGVDGAANLRFPGGAWLTAESLAQHLITLSAPSSRPSAGPAAPSISLDPFVGIEIPARIRTRLQEMDTRVRERANLFFATPSTDTLLPLETAMMTALHENSVIRLPDDADSQREVIQKRQEEYRQIWRRAIQQLSRGVEPPTGTIQLPDRITFGELAERAGISRDTLRNAYQESLRRLGRGPAFYPISTTEVDYETAAGALRICGKTVARETGGAMELSRRLSESDAARFEMKRVANAAEELANRGRSVGQKFVPVTLLHPQPGEEWIKLQIGTRNFWDVDLRWNRSTGWFTLGDVAITSNIIVDTEAQEGEEASEKRKREIAAEIEKTRTAYRNREYSVENVRSLAADYARCLGMLDTIPDSPSNPNPWRETAPFQPVNADYMTHVRDSLEYRLNSLREPRGLPRLTIDSFGNTIRLQSPDQKVVLLEMQPGPPPTIREMRSHNSLRAPLIIGNEMYGDSPDDVMGNLAGTLHRHFNPRG